LKGQYNLQRSQSQNHFPSAVLDLQRKSGEFQFKDGVTLRVETFDEWRSTYATALLISMISGLVSSALMKQEV
jgi:hypothetical protein